MGLALVALLTITDGLGVEASAALESRAGEAPIRVGETPTAFVAEILTPLVELRLRAPALSLRWGYGPRILWQSPNPNDRLDPLILHTTTLGLDARLSPAVSAKAAAVGAIGQPDYTTLSLLLGPMQGSLPSVMTIASASARAAVLARLQARLQLEVTGQVQHWRRLDDDVAGGGGGITGQTWATLEPAVMYRVTRRHDVGLGNALGAAWYSNGAEVLTVSPRARWRAALSARHELRLLAGLTFAADAGTVPAVGSSGRAISPVGSLEVDGVLAKSGGVALRYATAGGVDLFLDAVLGTADPRGSARAAVMLTVSPNWMASARGDFATVLRTVPRPDNADETIASAAASVRRRLSLDLYAELGIRWADRAPALASPTFGFHQRQTWGYFTIVGTTSLLGGRPRPPL